METKCIIQRLTIILSSSQFTVRRISVQRTHGAISVFASPRWDRVRYIILRHIDKEWSLLIRFTYLHRNRIFATSSLSLFVSLPRLIDCECLCKFKHLDDKRKKEEKLYTLLITKCCSVQFSSNVWNSNNKYIIIIYIIIINALCNNKVLL